MRAVSNRKLLIPFFAPYAAYVVLGLALERWGPSVIYTARLLIVPAVLLWVWRYYQPLFESRARVGGSIAAGILGGVFGTALWVALVAPFAAPDPESWTTSEWGLRLVASATLPAVFEEFLFRGLALGLALQWQQARLAREEEPWEATLDDHSVHELPRGAWSVFAVALSSALFALGHAQSQWLAAFAYGLLMCGLWITRRDLGSCVVAHGTTNLTLALYIRTTGQWQLW